MSDEKTIDDIRRSFVGEHPLVGVLRQVLHEVTTGDTVSRAYRAQQILEQAIAEHGNDEHE